MKIDAHDRRIDEMFKGSTFLIPRFQRAYSWQSEQITQFWTDVVENMKESYFIGSMVVYKTDDSSFSVIDGQQRLTTIAILLCAIRDGFKNLEENDLAAGAQTYIERRDKNNKVICVLQNETAYPYLQEKVFKDGLADEFLKYNPGQEEKAIADAFSIFSKKIKSKTDECIKTGDRKEVTDWLVQLRDTVLDLKIVFVALDNQDDAYLIYETLNTRGKDLSLSDLLRYHFTKFIRPEGDVDHTVEKWQEMLKNISSVPLTLDPDTFISHSWQSRFESVTKARTYSKVRAIVVEENVEDHLNQFIKDSEHWRSIFDTKFKWTKGENDAAKSLDALRIFNVYQPAPGILSLIRAYRDKKIKLKMLTSALSSIEKFFFSFTAITSSRSSGGMSKMYSSFGRQIYSAKDSNIAASVINDFKEKLRFREVVSSKFDAGFGQVKFTKSHPQQKSLVRYILKKVSTFEHLPFVGETDDLTIEHLLPQSREESGEDSAIIGQIGNLILVDRETNVLLSNKNYLEKKEILRKRGYRLPPLLENANKIDKSLISRNTKRISKLARDEIWKL